MKNIILSADSETYVYSVPNEVADNLENYCQYFCCEWLQNSPDAKKYRKKLGLQYNQEDFILYLNNYVFPNEKSILVENLGWINSASELPEKYIGTPSVNF